MTQIDAIQAIVTVMNEAAERREAMEDALAAGLVTMKDVVAAAVVPNDEEKF